MNSVPQYRAAIGCYAPIAQNAQNIHKLHLTLHVTELYDSYDHMIHIYAKLLRPMIILFASIYEYVFYACLRLRLILLGNDIETNPVPLFSSTVQGSFNQACVKYVATTLESHMNFGLSQFPHYSHCHHKKTMIVII